MSPVAFSRFLRYFRVVAAAGSIRRASEILNISASAVDRQILQAEAALNFQLFERLPSGLRLTAAGELFVDVAQRWARDYEQLLARIEDLRGLRRGHVRIALIEAMAKGFLAPLLSAVRTDAPGITVELEVMDNAEVVAAIAAGAVDFGLALNPSTSRAVAVRTHMPVGLGLVTHPDHPLARERSVRFNQTVAMPMIAPAEPLAMFAQFEMLQAASGVSPRVVARSNNIQMIKSLIAADIGVGVLAWIDIVEEAMRRELSFVPLADPALPPLVLGLCVETSRQLSSPARMMIDRCEARLMALTDTFSTSRPL